MNKKPYRRHVRTANVDPCDQLHLLLMEHACQAHKAPPDDIGGFTGSSADRRPLRLSKAERDLLRRMPRPAAPAFDGEGDAIRIDFAQAVAFNPNSDLEDEGGGT
jgi:hypothetical protein